MEKETGTLVHWNNEKGYGFIRPHNDKEDIFIHAKSLPHYQRHPKIGDVLAYGVNVDEKERYYACSAKITGMAWSRFSMIGLCLTVCMGVYVYLLFQQRLPFHPVAIYVAMSLLTIWSYHRDKRAAQLGLWRTPEQRLHILEALGGWPGAFLAQLYFRHKLRKMSYQIILGIIVAAHGVVWYHLLTHQERYQSYQEALAEHVHTIIHTVRRETSQFLDRHGSEGNERQTEMIEQTAMHQSGHRSLIIPAKHAHILEGIVEEIRPQEGVIVSLQSATEDEGIIDKATLVDDFFTRFREGERIHVVIHTITIKKKKKRIELVLVEE